MFCTFGEVLEVQVPPREFPEVLRTLRNSGLLQQAVCTSGLGYTQDLMRETSSNAWEVTRSFRGDGRADKIFQSEQRRYSELVPKRAWLR
jgi:hypothetical protein